MTRKVTENDFRMPEFKDKSPDDYEFRSDGKIVRKDRWEMAIHRIKYILGDNRKEFEIEEIISSISNLIMILPSQLEQEPLDE